MHQINPDAIRDDKQLTLAVLQIGQLLGLYNTELGAQPFLMLVDEGRLDVVTRYLEDAST